MKKITLFRVIASALLGYGCLTADTPRKTIPSQIIPLHGISQKSASQRTLALPGRDGIGFRRAGERALHISLVDSSKNGFGLARIITTPLALTDAGWLIAYRQWTGPSASSANIGAAWSPDGDDWTPLTDGTQSIGMGLYPSALATAAYPYVFWTGPLNPGEDSQPLYAFADDQWGGSEFSAPFGVDPELALGFSYSGGHPDLAHNDTEGLDVFNEITTDVSGGAVYLFHGEGGSAGDLTFSDEQLMFDLINDFNNGPGGSFASEPTVDVNDAGIGYAVISAFMTGAVDDGSTYTNIHGPVLRMTGDYGETWSGGQAGSPYLFIPQSVFADMLGDGYPESDEFPASYSDPCDPLGIDFVKLYCTNAFDLKVDGEGNPHILIGVLPQAGDGLYPGLPFNGLYHFWIDKDYIANPGPPQTETGWHYSRVMAMEDMWRWENEDGEPYLYSVFPSLAISRENDAVLWVVVAGPSPGEFVLTDDGGTPDVACDDSGVYPTWNEEVFVVRSGDGGVTWQTPVNLTDTQPDCWAEDGVVVCAAEQYCSDGVLNNPCEVNAHAGTEATDYRLPLVYQSPDWCYGSTTDGSESAQNHKNRIFVGYYEGEVVPGCTDAVALNYDPAATLDDGSCWYSGDPNHDAVVDVLDIMLLVNAILTGGQLDGLEFLAADVNGDGIVDIMDILLLVNLILES